MTGSIKKMRERGYRFSTARGMITVDQALKLPLQSENRRLSILDIVNTYQSVSEINSTDEVSVCHSAIQEIFAEMKAKATVMRLNPGAKNAKRVGQTKEVHGSSRP